MSAAIFGILNLGNLCAILVILAVTLMALSRLSLLRPLFQTILLQTLDKVFRVVLVLPVGHFGRWIASI